MFYCETIVYVCTLRLIGSISHRGTCNIAYSNAVKVCLPVYTVPLIGPISYLDVCYYMYIRTKVKCIREKITLYFRG